MSNSRILNRFFSQVNFEEMLKENQLFEGLMHCSVKSQKSTDLMVIEQMYDDLRSGYRNEYFYKNTLFNRHILGKHSLNTTSAITELPIEQSKADFIKINGEAVVYEIKTDLDSFVRLKSQISDYLKAFTKVYLVTSEAKSAKALELLEGTDVGLLVLTNRDYFSERKKASANEQFLKHTTIFQILRKYEFETIIKMFYGELPKTAPAFYYKSCFERFKEIPMNELHPIFVNILKQRNKVVPSIIKRFPYEIRYLAYFSSYIRKNTQYYEKVLNYKRG